MPSFTLDTNCLIDVAEGRPHAQEIMYLLDLEMQDQVQVGLAVSSASECQRTGDFLKDFSVFEERRNQLGFGRCRLLPVVGMFGVTFWGNCLYGSEESAKREQLIFECLFPNSTFCWSELAAELAIPVESSDRKEYYRWRNKILDTKAYWAHEHAGYDFFVTSDKNFKN